jgi:hypothetical protein
MPLYTYQCKCGKTQDSYKSIADRKNCPTCECGGETKLIIVPTQIAPVIGGGDFPGYKCPVTDTFVSSRKQRREIMKKHDLVEKG